MSFLQQKLDAEFHRVQYLSDGAYVGYGKDDQIWIFTSNGISILNRVCLDTYAIDALNQFVNDLRERNDG